MNMEMTHFVLRILLLCRHSLYVSSVLRFVLSSGIRPVLCCFGGNAFFEAGEGQGHQRHNQPAGVHVPQRECCPFLPALFILFDRMHGREEIRPLQR